MNMQNEQSEPGLFGRIFGSRKKNVPVVAEQSTPAQEPLAAQAIDPTTLEQPSFVAPPVAEQLQTEPVLLNEPLAAAPPISESPAVAPLATLQTEPVESTSPSIAPEPSMASEPEPAKVVVEEPTAAPEPELQPAVAVEQPAQTNELPGRVQEWLDQFMPKKSRGDSATSKEASSTPITATMDQLSKLVDAAKEGSKQAQGEAHRVLTQLMQGDNPRGPIPQTT